MDKHDSVTSTFRIASGRSVRLNLETLCAVAIAAVFFAISVRWLWLYRRDQIVDVDEAAYISYAITDYIHLLHGGLRDFFAAVWAPSGEAPLTNAFTALLFCITRPHQIVAFMAPLLAGTATVFAAYLLGSSVGSRRLGLISALLTACCPLIIDLARTLQFANPATFVATMSLVAMLRSDRFRRLEWAATFGIFCGLLPLTRTMTIAFLPGLVLGAIVYGYFGVDRRRRSLILWGALLLAFLVAGSWLIPNGRYVFEYLFDFGYAGHAAEYGPKVARFGFEDWVVEARTLLKDVRLPYFLLFVLGAAIMVGAVIRVAMRVGIMAIPRVVVSSKIFPLVFFVAEATVALASSQNKGYAFFAPLVPTAVVLAVWSSSRLCNYKQDCFVLGAVALVIAAFGLLPALDLRLEWAKPWAVELPLLGHKFITDGRAPISIYESYFIRGDALEPIPPEQSKRWVDLNSRTAEIIRGNGVTALGFRNAFFNSPTINLQGLLISGIAANLVMIDPIETGDSIDGYLRWLMQGDAAHACLLLTSDDEKSQFLPAINTDSMAEAARQANFIQFNQFTMPNGHLVRLWRRQNRVRDCQV